MENTTENKPEEEQVDDTGLQDKYLESNWEEQIEKFEELDLKKDLLRGIYGYGFVKPSVIQQKGILPMIKRKDTIAQAQSGSGKTGTFTIGCLQVIDISELTVQCLILAPTRELAKQTNSVVNQIGNYLGVKVH